MDGGKLSFTPAVEISRIRPDHQKYIAVSIKGQQSSPSKTQAKKLREMDEKNQLNPDAHPLLHSDRGFQYTTARVFHDKLAAAGMMQSMSRVGKCIDNGPMEGF